MSDQQLVADSKTRAREALKRILPLYEGVSYAPIDTPEVETVITDLVTDLMYLTDDPAKLMRRVEFHVEDEHELVTTPIPYNQLLGLAKELVGTIQSMQSEHKLHGHITDARAHWLTWVEPRTKPLFDEEKSDG